QRRDRLDLAVLVVGVAEARGERRHRKLTVLRDQLQDRRATLLVGRVLCRDLADELLDLGLVARHLLLLEFGALEDRGGDLLDLALVRQDLEPLLLTDGFVELQRLLVRGVLLQHLLEPLQRRLLVAEAPLLDGVLERGLGRDRAGNDGSDDGSQEGLCERAGHEKRLLGSTGRRERGLGSGDEPADVAWGRSRTSPRAGSRLPPPGGKRLGHAKFRSGVVKGTPPLAGARGAHTPRRGGGAGERRGTARAPQPPPWQGRLAHRAPGLRTRSGRCERAFAARSVRGRVPCP